MHFTAKRVTFNHPHPNITNAAFINDKRTSGYSVWPKTKRNKSNKSKAINLGSSLGGATRSNGIKLVAHPNLSEQEKEKENKGCTVNPRAERTKQQVSDLNSLLIQVCNSNSTKIRMYSKRNKQNERTSITLRTIALWSSASSFVSFSHQKRHLMV